MRSPSCNERGGSDCPVIDIRFVTLIASHSVSESSNHFLLTDVTLSKWGILDAIDDAPLVLVGYDNHALQ